jgi:hypothetical protein
MKWSQTRFDKSFNESNTFEQMILDVVARGGSAEWRCNVG